MAGINTREYWNDIWEKEGVTTWRQYPGVHDRILKEIGTGKRITDVGCGVGILLNKLKEADNFCFGMDISDKAIKKMWEVFEIPGMSVEFPRDTPSVMRRDFVIATEFLEHFPRKQTDQLLEQLAKMGRNIIVTVPNNCAGPEECDEHERTFSPMQLKEHLSKYFEDVWTEEFIDQFESGNHRIRLPCLMGFGRNKK